MSAEENTPLLVPQEFTIRLSGFMLFIKRLLLVGAAWAIVASGVEAITSRQPFFLLTGIVNGCIYYAVATYALRTFPRKVSIEGNSVVFHKVPTTWINLNLIMIPIGITQRMTRSKSEVVLEWIGRSLNLNDMINGKTIRLASGKHGDELAEWFKSNGISNPVGG